MTSLLGEVVARGTRSWIHAYGHGAVAKVPHPSTPTDWIYAEAEYAEAARAVGAPVPRLLGIEHINGRAASVWERVEGAPMWQVVVDQPKLSGDLGRLLADIQCALFELVPPVTLPSQRDRLAAKIRRSAAIVDASLARALDLLPVPASPPRVCHGDLHPSNVILSREGAVIVDWFDASRGDPIADVARTSMTLLGDGRSGPRHLPGSDGRTLLALTKAYRSRLQERLELEDDLVARWEAIQAVARMAEGLPRGALLEVWMRFVDIENRALSITEAPDSQQHQVVHAAAS